MGFKIISDNYGNQRRISDSPDKTNIVLGIDRKRLDNRYIKEDLKKEDTTDNINESNTLHSCIKGIGSCQEKDDGSMWLYVGTYKGRVNFCPYCGFKAKEQRDNQPQSINTNNQQIN